MSFLAGRLAAKEGAYFLQESKQAVNRLADKTPKFNTDDLSLPSSPESHADILPEVLKHSIPSKILTDNSSSSRSSAPLTASSKWSLHSSPSNSSPVSHDALNPVSAYVSLPQVTFGPKRWSLPSSEHSILASTANEMRKDRYAPVNPQKLKAATEGLAHVGKAFAVATLIVFGGATVVFALAASKLELHNINDIRAKGKDIVRPKFEMIKDQMVPLRTWAEDKSKKWHIEKEEGINERAIVKELSKTLGTKTSS